MKPPQNGKADFCCADGPRAMKGGMNKCLSLVHLTTVSRQTFNGSETREDAVVLAPDPAIAAADSLQLIGLSPAAAEATGAIAPRSTYRQPAGFAHLLWGADWV